MRSFVETIVVLVIAVSLVRALAAEGYMISTGSMAPTLRGYHRMATCPTCGHRWACGAVPQRLRSGRADTSSPIDDAAPTVADCPLCQSATVTGSARTEGDQLLVHKHAYALRPPRRFEVVVFRNPENPAEAYIKRVAGLPGETVAIDRGDVHIDGRLVRKALATQQAMALPVSIAGRDRRNRWQPEDGWSRRPGGFAHTGPRSTLRYVHRIDRGGLHQSRVPIVWPNDYPPQAARLFVEDGHLCCVGAMPADVQRRLRTLSDRPDFTAAIDTLADRSRRGPVTDRCGYNPPGPLSQTVRDLMLTATLRRDPASTVRLTLLYGRQPFVWQFDSKATTLRTLDPDGDETILQTASPRAGGELTLSVIDRQVTAAIGGVPVWEPLPFAETALTAAPTPQPVTIEAGGDCRLSMVTLWRDVAITPPDDPQPVTLGPDEFYVLGDNSPVSVDSRRWDEPTVPGSSLIGKPLAVHLPSRQVELPVVGPVRVPDFERIRVVR